MGTIIDFKNAVRKSVYTTDNSINFFFNKIIRVQYPYIKFYMPSYNPKGSLSTKFWKNREFFCVLEYAKSENNTETELAEYEDTLLEMIDGIVLYDKKINIETENIDIKYVDGVLQATFNATLWIKLEDMTELMQELDLTII